MRRRSAWLLAACLAFAYVSAHAASLPDNLTLKYRLYYGSLSIGEVTKTLKRESSGVYSHTMWTRPVGLARAFTHVEWFEAGRFRVRHGEIEPQSFSESRKGDKRAYDRSMTFDWHAHRIERKGATPLPLLPGTQDQSSIFYTFMLRPLTNGARTVTIANGKDVDPYQFVFRGTARLETPLGQVDTLVIERLSQKQTAEHTACLARTHNPTDCAQTDDSFLIWIAPSKDNIAVKLRQHRRGQTFTLVLESATGL